VSEDRFRAQVVRRARQLDWMTMFIGRGKGGGNWVTQMGGDGKGWPDLTLVRERVVCAELKTDTNYHVSPEEKVWLERLKLAGIETYIWRPRHWEQIEEVLAHRDPDQWRRLLSAADGDVAQVASVDRMLTASRRRR